MTRVGSARRRRGCWAVGGTARSRAALSIGRISCARRARSSRRHSRVRSAECATGRSCSPSTRTSASEGRLPRPRQGSTETFSSCARLSSCARRFSPDRGARLVGDCNHDAFTNGSIDEPPAAGASASSNGSTPCQSPGSCGGFSPASSFGGGSSPSPIPFASASAPSAAQFQMQAQLQQRGLSKKGAVAKPGGRRTHPRRPLTDAHVCAHAGCKRRCMAPPSRARWRCREGLTSSGTLTARYHPASCRTRPTRGAHSTSRRYSRRRPLASRPTCRRPLSTYGTPALVKR